MKKGDSGKSGFCALTITEWDDGKKASKGFEGERDADAKCYVRTRECDGNQMESTVEMAVDQYLT